MSYLIQHKRPLFLFALCLIFNTLPNTHAVVINQQAATQKQTNSSFSMLKDDQKAVVLTMYNLIEKCYQMINTIIADITDFTNSKTKSLFAVDAIFSKIYGLANMIKADINQFETQSQHVKISPILKLNATGIISELSIFGGSLAAVPKEAIIAELHKKNPTPFKYIPMNLAQELDLIASQIGFTNTTDHWADALFGDIQVTKEGNITTVTTVIKDHDEPTEAKSTTPTK